MDDQIRYTVQSVMTGHLYTFTDAPQNFAKEVRLLRCLQFNLVGVEGVDGYVCPPVRPLCEAGELGHNL